MSSQLRRRGSKNSAQVANDAPRRTLGTVLVVGGGPAGALAAKTLSDRNYATTLCEAYPHPSGSAEKRHAYVISLQSRGIRALRRVGVDPFSDIRGVANRAYVRHGARAGSKPRVIRKDDANLIVRRRQLTADLLGLAERGGATVVCGEKLTNVDFDGRVATFLNADTGAEVKRAYDLLVAADGVKSVTRALLETKGLLGPTRKEADDMAYQVAVMPHWREMLLPTDVDIPEVCTHTWASRSDNSNSITFPLDGKSTLVCVIGPMDTLEGLKTSPDGYGPFLARMYPNWTEEARAALAEQLSEEDNTVTSGGTCVWTASLAAAEAGVVLLGDSGHGMWPSLGQGCNAALESVSVLADAVEAACGDPAGLPVCAGAGARGADVREITLGERGRWVAEEFDRLRHDDAKAVVSLTFDGIGSRRTRGRQNGKVMFLIQMAMMMLLNKITVGIVPKPALLRVMAGSPGHAEVPSYSTLRWQHRCERALVNAIFAATTIALVAYLFM